MSSSDTTEVFKEEGNVVKEKSSTAGAEISNGSDPEAQAQHRESVFLLFRSLLQAISELVPKS